MLNIGYFKAQPTEYILKYGAGRLTREGAGLAFFFWKHSTQIVAVATSSMDSSFVFNEVTNNFQSVTIQGQLTYRIHSPRQAAALLNFTIDPRTRAYTSNDPDRMAQRIINVVQMETRGELQKLTLEEALSRYEAVAATVQRRVKEGALLEGMGAELLSVYFVAAKPTPEVGKALEATYREELLRKADEAIYARRYAAVEEERKIKENELSTDIALERQREQLIERKGANDLAEAENRGKALEREAEFRARANERELAVYKAFDPRSLVALSMNEMGRNAERLGNLTITSEVLASLLNGTPSGRDPNSQTG